MYTKTTRHSDYIYTNVKKQFPIDPIRKFWSPPKNSGIDHSLSLDGIPTFQNWFFAITLPFKKNQKYYAHGKQITHCKYIYSIWYTVNLLLILYVLYYCPSPNATWIWPAISGNTRGGIRTHRDRNASSVAP